ncbi:TPA: M protein [Streptococcus pyogenes]|nr:M protein [Streptococcus pyogenes]
MARENTNKHYSLRKLKKGTASVAVALSVIGAGLVVNTNEVSATVLTRNQKTDLKFLNELAEKNDLEIHRLNSQNDKLIGEKKALEEEAEQAKQKNGTLETEKNRLTTQNEELKNEVAEKEKNNKTLQTQNEDLTHENGQLKAENKDYEAENGRLESDNRRLEGKNKDLEGDLKVLKDALDNTVSENIKSSDKYKKEIGELKSVNKDLKEEAAKKEEQNKISDASRKGLRRDLDASREAKKQVEKDLANLTAELDKVKEEKQVSDASRQGLRRDLDASREAKKQVEKALEEANSKLAALEKLNKELEESKKLTEKEKAELQAKLEAEAKALKEQLAKQAEELAKLRAGKASDSQTPDTKPGNKAVPGKGQAPQAGTKPNQNKAPMKETKRQLPSTGEATNPFFTAAALTVMATAGVAAVVKRKEEN